MQDDLPADLSRFGDDHGEATGELFKTAALLDVLRELRAADSLHGIRARVAELKQQLCSPDSPLRSQRADNTAIRLPQDYVIDELDQIAASQTIERAAYYV